MIRARFKANYQDPRPVEWPIKHSYWCTGKAADESHSIVVAHADDVDEIRRLWPEAEDIEHEEAEEYTFTSRFPRPDWLGRTAMPSAEVEK